MRVAALALGVLAGLVASLILALGGLDVPVGFGADAERQAQALRFGLFIIGNLGFFGAALVLASPLIGAIFLIVAAVAWVAAALLTQHSSELVLITPPALLLLAAACALVSFFRSPRYDDAEEIDDDPDAGEAVRRASRTEMAADDELSVPTFAAEPAAAPVRASQDWNPRRRQPPPPRAKSTFREIEDEYEEDEPSGFSRFALAMSSILSFGLYAALAGGAVLLFWSMRNDGNQPVITVADSPPSVVSSDPAPLSSSAEARLPTDAPVLTPTMTADAAGSTLTSPSTSPSELVAETTAPSAEPGSFGPVTLSDGPVLIPRLNDDFFSTEDPGPLADQPTATPPSLEPEPESTAFQSPEAEAAISAEPPSQPLLEAPVGQPFPRSVPPQMAAQRMARGTGPTIAAAPPANRTNTGL